MNGMEQLDLQTLVVWLGSICVYTRARQPDVPVSVWMRVDDVRYSLVYVTASRDGTNVLLHHVCGEATLSVEAVLTCLTATEEALEPDAAVWLQVAGELYPLLDGVWAQDGQSVVLSNERLRTHAGFDAEEVCDA
jgi:hypothetical protein